MLKLKQIISISLSVLLIFSATLLSASAKQSEDRYLTYVVEDGEATITWCNTLVYGDYAIPDTLGGFPVTKIDTYAFSGCKLLKQLSIPGSVTSIGYSVFSGCSSLTSITVDENNQNYSSDENGILFNRDKTELIRFPAGIDCSSYLIPDGVITVGVLSFEGCTSLESVTMSDSVTSIGSSAFEGCISLDNITIADSVTSIGNFAFEKCESLAGITIPDSVTSIGYGAFAYCTSLTSVIIPDSITSVPDVIFSGCTSLKSVEIPDSVTIIGEGAFQICPSLTSITVPGSVENIENHAFGYTYEGYECVLIDGFTIYGYDGTAAETYATENSITFVSLGEYVAPEELTTEEPTTEEPTTEEPTTDEPTTEAPTTAESTTAEPTTEAAAFTVSDESVAIDESGKQITISDGTSHEAFAAMIASGNAKVVSADGEELTADDLIGTGCKVQTLDESGNIVSEYTVIVPSDVDGNGKITAADARATLRTAAQLDTLEGVYAIAADFDADSAIKPSDARSILRVAAKLD